MNIHVLLHHIFISRLRVFALLLLTFYSYGQQPATVTRSRKADFVVTLRLHSTTHFPYTGSYINRHLNVDINLFYEKNKTGGFLFKSHNLEDPHSIANYLQPGIFRTFDLGKHVMIRVFGGYLFSQTSGFSDSDSDVWSASNTSWTINKFFKVEHTALFFNLTKTELHRQLANRIVVSALLREFKLDLYFWHNHVFEMNNEFASGALAVNLPKIRLTDNIKIQNTFSYQTYLTANKPSYAMKHGFLFSIAVPVTVSSSE